MNEFDNRTPNYKVVEEYVSYNICIKVYECFDSPRYPYLFVKESTETSGKTYFLNDFLRGSKDEVYRKFKTAKERLKKAEKNKLEEFIIVKDTFINSFKENEKIHSDKSKKKKMKDRSE